MFCVTFYLNQLVNLPRRSRVPSLELRALGCKVCGRETELRIFREGRDRDTERHTEKYRQGPRETETEGERQSERHTEQPTVVERRREQQLQKKLSPLSG